MTIPLSTTKQDKNAIHATPSLAATTDITVDSHTRQPQTGKQTDKKNRGTAPKRNKKPNDSGHALSDNKHPRHEKGKKANADRNKRRPDNTKKRRSEQNGHST